MARTEHVAPHAAFAVDVRGNGVEALWQQSSAVCCLASFTVHIYILYVSFLKTDLTASITYVPPCSLLHCNAYPYD